MKKIQIYPFFFGIGGSIYYGLELLCRGFSHWTMFALGGACMVFITVQGVMTNFEDSIWTQIGRCIIFTIAGEFVTGIIVNKYFKLQVWDYSQMPLQLWGQICVPFMILFAALCGVGIIISRNLLYWIYGNAIIKRRM